MVQKVIQAVILAAAAVLAMVGSAGAASKAARRTAAANADIGVYETGAWGSGGNLVFSWVVYNDGPGNAADVSTRESLGAGASLVSMQASQAVRCVDVSCDLGALASGAEAYVTAIVHPALAGQLVNGALISSADDSTPGNNSYSVTMNVTSPPPAIGNAIAYAANLVGNEQIFSMNFDGTSQTNLSAGPFNDAYPSASPDRSRIVFQRGRGDADEIWSMNVDGSAKTQLTSNTFADIQPAYSPDGSKIVFASDRDNPTPDPVTGLPQHQVYVMNANGTAQTRLTNESYEDEEPGYSPDGTKVAYMRCPKSALVPCQIVVMNPDGSGQTVITSGSDNEYPSWSPNGKQIYFDSDRDDPNPGDSQFIYHVYRVNADGSGSPTLVFGAGAEYAHAAVDSPSDTETVFASDRANPGGAYDLYVVPQLPATQNVVRLTSAEYVSHPSWLVPLQSADVAIQSVTMPPEVDAGQDFTYHVTVSSAGPSIANHVVVTDDLPAGTTFVSATATGPVPVCASSGGSVSCSIWYLTPSTTSDVAITVHVPVVPDGTTIGTAASVASGVPDPISGNDSGSAQTTVRLQLHMHLKIVVIDPPTAGQPATVAVSARDDVTSDLVPDYRGTVHFTSSDPAAELPADYTFTADDAGRRSFAVIFHNAGAQAVTAEDDLGLSDTATTDVAEGTGPSVTPGLLDFGPWFLGQRSAIKMVRLTAGAEPLTIQSIGLLGKDPNYFSRPAGGSCFVSQSLAPGQSCDQAVQFRTYGAGLRTAILRFTTSAGDANGALSGTGVTVVPTISVAPPSIDFGAGALGKKSAPQQMTIQNTGTSNVTISFYGISSASTDPKDFLLAAGTCVLWTALVPGDSCTLGAAFRPQGLGERSAIFVLKSTAGETDIPLAGTGANPPIPSPSPMSVDFGPLPVGMVTGFDTITLHNTGGLPLAITVLGISPQSTNKADFQFRGNGSTCSTSTIVAPGDSCYALVRFRPQAPGARSAVFNFKTNGGVASVALTGTGT